MSKRYVLRATLTCLTAFHLGGLANTPATDKSLARDGRGRLYVPGTSIAGVLRALLSAQDTDAERSLFGYQTGLAGQRSRLLVDHGYFLPGSPQPEIRDFVRINPHWGVAEDQHKFDSEVLPAGAKFSLRLEYEAPDLANDPASAHRGFLALVKLLADSHQMQFGAGFAKGLGRIGVENPARDLALWRFDFPSQQSCQNYLTLLKLENSQDDWHLNPTGCNIPPMQLANLRSELTIGLPVQIELQLTATGPFLVSSDEQGKTVDRMPYQENGQYIIPGSTIRGALRHRAIRIVNTLLNAWGYRTVAPKCWADVGEKAVEPLFGSTALASILGITDCRLPANAVLQEVHNVAIDRFTGGARDGRLFSSCVFWSKSTPLTIPLSITIRKVSNNDGLLGLLAHALYDLATEDVAVGHAKTSGHGRVQCLSCKVSNWTQAITINNHQEFPAYALQFQSLQTQFEAWLRATADRLVQEGFIQRMGN